MPKSDLEQSELKIKMANAGFRSESAAAIYSGIRLASLGIQFGQGYALGRPGPLDDVIAAVADRAPGGRERPFTENKSYTTPSGIPIMFKHA